MVTPSEKHFPAPHLIEFNSIGQSDIGYISIAEQQKEIPFDIQRVFWTYFTPESITRGRHAHKITEQVLIAVAGKITVRTESADGKENHTFVLERPNKGVYIPPNVWHTMEYSHTAVQLVFASTKYQSEDYLRDYQDFKKYWE